jgi:hypothetical protein
MKVFKGFIFTSLILVSHLAFAEITEVSYSEKSITDQTFERHKYSNQYKMSEIQGEGIGTLAIKDSDQDIENSEAFEMGLTGNTPGYYFSRLILGDDNTIYIKIGPLNSSNSIGKAADPKFQTVGFKVNRKPDTIALEFTRGTWEDYIAGDDVELQVTQEGTKVEDEFAKAIIENGYQRSLEVAYPHLTFKPVSIELFERESRTVLKGNLNSFQVFEGPISFKVSGSCKIPEIIVDFRDI